MAWDDKVGMRAVLADQGPAHKTIAGHGSVALHRLYLTDGSFVILNEILAIGSDGKGATGVENANVDNVVISTSREKRRHEVRVEV
jgi:hypothetical protein